MGVGTQWNKVNFHKQWKQKKRILVFNSQIYFYSDYHWLCKVNWMETVHIYDFKTKLQNSFYKKERKGLLCFSSRAISIYPVHILNTLIVQLVLEFNFLKIALPARLHGCKTKQLCKTNLCHVFVFVNNSSECLCLCLCPCLCLCLTLAKQSNFAKPICLCLCLFN